MRISEQFESYNHYNVRESELKEIAIQVGEKLDNCRVGYTSIKYEDGKQISFIIINKTLWNDFETKLEFGQHNIRLLNLSELKCLEQDWESVLKKYDTRETGGVIFNKYTQLIEKIHWIDLDENISDMLIHDKLVALLSLLDSITEEYSLVGTKDKVETRKELERLYHITYNLCNIIHNYTIESSYDVIVKLDKELKIFREPLVLDSRDGKGKYAELIRFCKNVNWNKAGLTVLIHESLASFNSNIKIN